MIRNDDDMLVSVTMPVYNGAAHVAEAIDSVLSQTHRWLELVVVDDGSRDASARIVEGYADQDTRVKFIRNPHRGISATRNAALQEAQGDLIAVMDADDIALPDRLEKQIKFMQCNPDCVAVGGQVLQIDASGDPIGPVCVKLEHDGIVRELLEGRGSAIIQPSVMLRKDIVLSVGGYISEYAPAEDLDLFLKLAEKGRLANLGTLILHFRRHAASTTALRDEQSAMAQRTRIVQAALQRRGLSQDYSRVSRFWQPQSNEELYLSWALLAFRAGYTRSATKFARLALRDKPYSVASWFQVARTVLGRLGPHVVARRCGWR